MRHRSHWYEACATGTLPQVSILCPFVTLNGFGNDDHPHADMRNLPYLTKRMRTTNSIERAFNEFRSFDPEPHFAPYDAPAGTWKTSGVDALNRTINENAERPGRLPLVGSVVAVPDSPVPVPILPIPPDPIPGGSSHGEPSGVQKLAEMGWFDKFRIRTDWKIEDSYLHPRRELIEAARPRR